MDREAALSDLCRKTDSKIILLVMDGLGGLPQEGKTELETAEKPHLDELAVKGTCGLTDPVFMGITPGSGPAHLSLFGYDPLKYILGRGILEALGSEVEVGPNDLVARGNFATLQANIIIDRRAGRIPTSQNEEICRKINKNLKEMNGIKVRLYPGKEHRFVVKFSGEGLADALTDADPQKENNPPVPCRALSGEAERTAELVNRFVGEATGILEGSPQANTVILRGFSKHPRIPAMGELFKLTPAAVANYPMYKGLARLIGMKILKTGHDLPDLFDTLENEYDAFDFFYVHVKKTDSYGEDGNFDQKVKVIEKTDSFIPRILSLNPDVLAVTSDHSTPALLQGHSWHPNPFLLFSPTAQPDLSAAFTEKECSRGILGRFRAVHAMPLMLAHAQKLQKFGA